MSVETRASLILLFATLLAACGWVFSKETIAGLPPFGFIGLRFLLAALCLLPFAYPALKKMRWQDMARALGVGVFLGTALLVWIYAISITESLGEGAFIASLSMLFVPLVAWVLFREPPPRVFWVSLPIAVVGLATLSLSGASWQLAASQLWFLLSAVLLSVHFNLNSRTAQRIPVIALTCLQLFVTGVMGMALSLTSEGVPAEIAPSIWGWFTLSVLVATSLRYLMQTLGQKGANPTNAALIMILEPIWTVLLSVLWYQEPMPVNKIIGCALILLSLFVFRFLGRLINKPVVSHEGG